MGVRDKLILGVKPYISAIREIEKISTLDNPVDMVQCLSLSFARLKSEVVDFHKGKFELESMDDVLPLTIYCVAFANLPYAASFHNIMQDFLRQVNGFDLERKLLCNFDCAIKFVCTDSTFNTPWFCYILM